MAAEILLLIQSSDSLGQGVVLGFLDVRHVGYR